MTKIKFNLVDTAFKHEKYSVAGQESQFVEWNRDTLDSNLYTFYTNEQMYFNTIRDKDKSFGWLTEPPCTSGPLYLDINKIKDNFKAIFTFYQPYLDQRPDIFKLFTPGGVWIGGKASGGEVKVYQKDKLVSMLSSNKTFSPGHASRFELAKSLKDSVVDVYGLDKYAPMLDALSPYMFSIAVENQVLDNFFTEKLLNCMAVGTVPIYHGAPNISKWFNMDGVITFNTKDELNTIIQNLSKEKYEEMIPAIQDNLERISKFIIGEDILYQNYFAEGKEYGPETNRNSSNG